MTVTNRLAILTATLLLLQPASALDHATTKYKVNVPPSAQLNYSIHAQQSGLSLDGQASLQWTSGGQKFQLVTETRAMLVGKILEAKSEGNIDTYGLAPLSFTEKRLRKDPTTTTFDRTANLIHFTGTDATYPIKGGEQDRNSAVWQLISVARGAPDKFKPASEWNFFVAGQHDAENWRFKVVKQEKIDTPLGSIDAVHIQKVSAPDSKDQQLDIWLAPSREWYPVRLRFTEADGDFIEQNLQQIDKK